MKISTVLKKAKPHLESVNFVCWAINRADAPWASCERAKKYIRKLIHPHSTVTQWLHENGVGPHLTYHYQDEYRRRWIDHMIATLEKEGR